MGGFVVAHRDVDVDDLFRLFVVFQHRMFQVFQEDLELEDGDFC